MTMFLTVALGIVALASLIFLALRVAQDPEAVSPWPMIELDWAGGLLIVTLATVEGLRRLLSRTFADVVFWASIRETDQRSHVRNRIIEVGANKLRHALQDSKCHRVVVVAHSLGTTVAYEALLALGRSNRARSREDPFSGPLQLSKLDQFITLGSPIDKLHYFVETRHSSSQLFEEVHDELHGDLGSAPFSRNRKPRIHWINIWDAADVVSGSLESPMSRDQIVVRPVDNVEVSMAYFPDPILSHSLYLADRRVVRIIFESIFHSAHSYRTPPRMGPDHEFPDKPNYDAQDLPDGTRFGLARPIQAWLLLLPWLTAAFWAANVARAPDSVVNALGWSAGLSLGLLVIAALINRLAPARTPLESPESDFDDAPAGALLIGEVEVYFRKVGAAGFTVRESPLAIGDVVTILGHTTEVRSMTIDSIHDDDGPTDTVEPGRAAAIKVPTNVARHDRIYLHTR